MVKEKKSSEVKHDDGPWTDPDVRRLIDEWIIQAHECTRNVYPGAYVDQYGKICGQTPTAIIDCTQPPDMPPNWDSYRYLWETEKCQVYYLYQVRTYVTQRQNGASRESLATCKRRDQGCL